MSTPFETFGKYKLAERIAFGGMAEVFLATVHGEAGFMKPVVIKRLHPRMNEDSEFVQMLVDEARITSQLNHTNICQVLDLGSVDNSYYIAMEFVSGEDVRTVQDHFIRKKEHLPIEASIYLMAECLAGLDYAHRKEDHEGVPLGIVHRDISPQNILISYEGEVKVIDFGIAKARSKMVQTEVGVIKGKFRYMSPEQASGGNMDLRTDIFAAGVVLYELIRGEPHAINLADTEVLLRMRKAEFEPLRRFRQDMPSALEKAIKKALHLKPSKRYQTAQEFRAALLKVMMEMGVSYGRTELSGLMHEVFDAERRKKRSGTLTTSMSLASHSPFGVAAPPAAPVDPTTSGQTSTSGSLDEAPGYLPSPASVQRTRPAPTMAPGPPRPRATVAPGPSPRPPTRQALEVAPTAELDVNLIDSEYGQQAYGQEGPPGAQQPEAATTAYYPRSDEDSVQTVAATPSQMEAPYTPRPAEQVRGAGPAAADPYGEQQAGSPAWGPVGGQGGPPDPAPTDSTRRRTHWAKERFQRERTNVMSQSREGSRPAAEHGRPPPHMAETAPRDERRRRGGAGRFVVGLIVMGVLGGGVALAWLVSGGSLDSLTSMVKGALGGASADAGVRAEVTLDAAPRPDRARIRTTSLKRRHARIRVTSQPEKARVNVCGKWTGKTTPARLRVKAGRRCQLELVLDGYETYRMPVTLRAGGPLVIHATLRRSTPKVEAPRAPPSKGTLLVTSIQTGGVYVNDTKAGRTPRAEIHLRPGRYRVKVYFDTLDRYSSTKRVIIHAGKTARVNFESSF